MLYTETKLYFLLHTAAQRCLSPAVIALNLFFHMKLSWWSSFPPESSIAELQPRCTVTDSTSVWGLLRFPAGEKKRKKKTLSHFISSIRKREEKNLLQTSSRCRKWHKVWQGSLSAAFLMLFFLLSQIISLHSFSPFFKTIWVFLELPFFFRMRNVKYRCWNKGTLWCKSLASSEFMSKHKKGG